MRSLIIFTAENNRYAIDIDKIERIMQAQTLTPQAGSSEILDGVMSYQDNVVKIVNFRKIIGLKKFETLLVGQFDAFKDGHKEWINELLNLVKSDDEFANTTDTLKCDLGQWLDSYRPYDPEIEKIYTELFHLHREFHEAIIEVFEKKKRSIEEALEWVNGNLVKKYDTIMKYLDFMQKNMDKVALSLQKYLLYKEGQNLFGIKVDDVEDIVHIDEEIIQGAKSDHGILSVDGVAEINGALVTIIGKVEIKEAA